MMGITITILIIVFTSLVSYQGFNKYIFIDRMKHSPFREWHHKEYYRLLTSGFVHADWVHLLVNMYVLYSFGGYLEMAYINTLYGNTIGRIIFILLYLLNIILANIPTLLRHKDNPSFASIGASGAVSGMIFIFILLQPWATMSLFFVVNVPAIVFGLGYLIYSSWAASKEHGRVDHTAHFAGAIAGVVMIVLLRKEILTEFFHKLIHESPF